MALLPVTKRLRPRRIRTKVSASQPASLSADELALVDSDVITAKAERYQPNVLVTGTLQANQRTAVQSTVNAQVIRVLADVGQAVRQGDALIQLDNRNSQDQVAQARADLAGCPSPSLRQYQSCAKKQTPIRARLCITNRI